MQRLYKSWWLVALRGVLAMLFGAIAMLFPATAVLALVLYIGILALAGGGLFIALAVGRAFSGERWGWWLFEGLIDVAFGLLVVLYPQITAEIFLLFIAVWAIILGIVQIINGVGLRGAFYRWWIPVLYGILSVVFGVLVLFDPFGGAIAVTFLIGAYAVAYGILLISGAIGMRRMYGRLRGGIPIL